MGVNFSLCMLHKIIKCLDEHFNVLVVHIRKMVHSHNLKKELIGPLHHTLLSIDCEVYSRCHIPWQLNSHPLMIRVVEQIELHLTHEHLMKLAFRESFYLLELYNSNYTTNRTPFHTVR